QPTDGSASFISAIYARSGLQSSAQKLYGSTGRWGGYSQEFPVIPGDAINASGYLASFSADDPLSGGAEAWLEIKYISNRGNEIAKYKSGNITNATNGWVQRSISSTVPDGAEIGVFSFGQYGPDGASGTVYFDDAYVEIIPQGYIPPPKNPFSKPQSTGPVQISGNTLLVSGTPFTIKGVCYQPTPIGSVPWQYDIFSNADIYNRDLPILRSMGANTLRTYAKVTTAGFLDACYNGGVNPIYVVMGFYIDGSSDLSSPAVRDSIKTDFRNYVSTFKNHPAVLMWSPGNETEWAYTGNDRDYYTLLNELAEEAYLEEGSIYHPVTATLMNLFHIDDNAFLTTDEDMDYLDIWGANIYEGITFGDAFDDFAHRSAKVFWIPEFGTDAWHTNNKFGNPADGYLDEASQNQLDVALWDEIAARTDVCSGGTVFAYSDEWWKDGSGSNSAHDYRGFLYSDTMIGHPDEYSNEEWYGVAAVSDNGTGPDIVTVRAVFNALASRWGGPGVSEPKMHIQDISMNLGYRGLFINGVATITVYDENNQPVPGVIVSGSWSGLTSDSDSGQTDSSGTVRLDSDKVRSPQRGSQFTLTVTNIVLSGWTYDSAANIETSDSISIP
ncbi:MAG: glycoside hydrolase family 2 TIM barrel-domain containing protein, partial [Candidatus Omnitrophota bacterium]|nr:glycoside hydrolase family 2 TIM barrel-domain containing protein [Candidatus Omnitrophota bacterium]